jgi:autotransporter-associated beta strand protein
MLAVNYGGASDYTAAQVVTLLGKTTFGATSTAFGFDTSNATAAVTYGNALAMAAGVTKLGTGILTLSGSNTYTGATTVAAGKLSVGGSTSASSAVGVSSGGTLGGSGIVGGNTTIASGGALAPGNSPGVLTVSGTTTFSSGSIFEWEIDTAQSNPTTNRSIAYDGLSTGAVAGSGAIFKIMLTGTQNFTDDFWNQDRTWEDIFKSADGSTTLSNWASVFSGGFQYSYNGKTVAPTSSGSFTLTGNSLTWSAVPEPSNLLAGMLAASALLRRRRSV